jgi:myosin heavy subunit
MAKRIERIDIAQNDVFEGIKESAKKAEMEVDLLAKALKLVNQGIDDVKGKAKGMQSNPIPTDVKGIKEQNQLQKDALALAKERERLEKLKTQTIKIYEKAEADATKRREINEKQEAKIQAKKEARYNREIENAKKLSIEQQKASEKSRLAELKLQKEREKSIDSFTEKERKAKEKQQSAEQSLQRQREKGIAQMQREAKQTAEANRPYNKLSATLNELRGKYKDLAVSGRENSTEARKMKHEIDSLDKTLKRVDGNVGQFQRNVGNYSSAFGKLRSALGSLGLTFGAGALIRESFNIVKDFDQGVANLASVLGTTRSQIQGLEKDAKRLGATTSFTAGEVANLQTEFAKLGFTEQEILKVTEGTLNLAAATGTELARAAEVAGSTLRGFGLDASETNRVTDVMAKSFSASALDMEKFAESMKYVAPIAKVAGLSIEETTAMLGAMANAGISGSMAGTSLRQIISQLDKTGKTTAEALKDLAKEGLNLAGAEDEVGKNAKTALLVLADQTTQIDKLSSSFNDAEGSAKKMADEQLNTLGGAVKLLTSAFEGYILGVNDASQAGSGFKDFIKYTAENLPKIISTLGKLLGLYLIMIARQKVLNSGLLDWSKNLLKVNQGMTEGSGNAQKFGNALKGIGWSVAIGLAVELGMKLWDIASGAEQSRANLARLEAQADKALKTGAEQVDKIMGKYNIRIEELNNQLKARKITQADYLKLLKVEQDVAVSGLKSYIQNANARRKGYEEDKKFLESFLAVNGQILGVGNEQRKRFKEIFKDTGIKDFTDSFGKITAQARMDAMAQLDANINGVNIKLKQYHEEIRKAGSESASTKAELEGLSKETDKNTTSNKKNTKSIEEKTKKYKDAKDVIDELIAKQKEYDDANLAQQDELDEGLVSAQRTNLDYELDAQERELQAVRDKYRRLEDLAIEFGYGQEELLEARLNEENEIRTKYAQEELQSEEEKQAKLLEEEKKALDERRNMRKELVDNVIDEMKRISTEEEKLIDDRIKAEQDLQSNLQAQANAGNISAQQSIVASMEAEKRATLEKQKEQRKQQALDDIKTLYNLINSNISSGDGVGIATTKAIASMGVIKSVAKVFSALTGFAKGTEWRLGDEHKPMFGGVDGHVVRVDSSEAIVKGSLMDKAERAGITSTSELVQLAVSQKLQPNMYAMNDDRLNYVPVAVKQKVDMSGVEKRIERLEATIKNKTEFSIDPYVLNGMVKGIVETQKTGNFSRKNIFK